MEPNSPPDLDRFILNLERQFDHPIPGGLQADALFRDLAEWTSLQALVVISSFDWDYGVNVSEAELGKARTIAELFQLVTAKIQER